MQFALIKKIQQRFVMCLVMVIGLLGSTAALALDPALVKQFSSLPAEQQAALAKQMGVDLNQLRARTVAPAAAEDASQSSAGQPRPQSEPVVYSNDDLKPFGYELFRGEVSTFAPVDSIPVPTDYIIGPGDSFRIQYLGKESGTLEVGVDRTGDIVIPDVGRVSVTGQTLAQAVDKIQQIIREKKIGVQADVSLGRLRTFRIYVLGEARVPGAYEVSSLATVSHALWVAGGVRETGSLRNVQLKRNGKIVTRIDYYDFLLRGDTSADRRLQPGDVVFVPPLGATVEVRGEVRRPARYEVLVGQDNQLPEVLRMAAGLRADADANAVRLWRMLPNGESQLYQLTAQDSFRISSGDRVEVAKAVGRVLNAVELAGAVRQPGPVQWFKGMRLTDLIRDVRVDLNPDADRDYGLIVRTDRLSGQISLQDFVPAQLQDPNSPANLALQAGDRVIILPQSDADQVTDAKAIAPDEKTSEATDEESSEALAPEGQASESRSDIFGRLVARLKSQTRDGSLPPVVRVRGEVNVPGEYPITGQGRLDTLIRAAGGLREAAYTLEVEIARQQVSPQGAKTELLTAAIADAPQIQPLDEVTIKRIPEFYSRVRVSIEGEVRFPGTYTLPLGSTLTQLIERAGGLTDNAYPKGALFSRKALRELEARRLAEARERLQKDLIQRQLETQDAPKATEAGAMLAKQLAEQLDTSRVVGRMTVNLPALLKGDARYDIRLQDEDSLKIPAIPDSVTVVGEVQYPTSHQFENGVSLQDYIARSGGATPNADTGRIYVVKANGQVWLPRSGSWFTGQAQALEPGDTIYVPLDVSKIDSLKMWTGISQIFYQIALGAAAINSF